MKRHTALALALLAGGAIGALGAHSLQAQTKPPVYYVGEIEVTNQEGYLKDFAPKSQAAIKASGGKFLALGGKPVGLAGDPPKSRIVIQEWPSMEAMKAWFDSPAQTELRAIQAKYSKVRIYVVPGVAPK